MKLLSLNCHSWQEKNQLEKIKYLEKTILEENFQIVALQEVSKKIGDETMDFYRLLSKELKGYHGFWDFSHIGYSIYEEGLCIFSKYPIIARESFYVSKDTNTNNWKSRKIVKVTLEVNGNKVDIYSCHMGWWNDEEEPFKEQCDRLLEKIKSSENISILMGDFNNDGNVSGEGYDYLLSKGLYDTYTLAKNSDEGITVLGEIDGWENSFERKRMDLILSTKPLEVEYSKVIFNGKNKKIISDHFGVNIQIRLK
ncbi:MAG: endonuclease/exonuclease/phosphatase family protein [Cetobacterium sp.]|uniref:endonuclease/exonuclease/phosphatase family protein n=1 Tax=Cetobacterium sp. TaxID=2071632 RepID=UPI003F399BF0